MTDTPQRRSTDNSSALTSVQAEVVKLTTWQNIRRYLLIAGASFMGADLLVTLAFVWFNAKATCENTATLAAITNVNIKEQQKTSADFLSTPAKRQKLADSFGITLAKLEKSIKDDARRSATYVAALNGLADAGCKGLLIKRVELAPPPASPVPATKP